MGFKVRNYNFPKNNLNPREWNKIIKKKGYSFDRCTEIF